VSFDYGRFDCELAILLSRHPEAVLCGRTVLALGEWLQDSTSLVCVAVKDTNDLTSFEEIELRSRSLEWFGKIECLVQTVGGWTQMLGLKCLPPELALADLYHWDSTHAPRVDELSIPARSAAKVVRAFEVFGTGLPAAFSEEFSKVRYTTRPSTVLALKRDVVLTFLAEHGVHRPYLFGSCARHEDCIGSDIDILVMNDEVLDVWSISTASSTLEAALGVPVQVVQLSEMGQGARMSALKDAVPLF